MRAAYVTSDGVRLHVQVDGPDGAPTVVLVHGLAASIALGWRAPGVIERLGAAGLRTVAYDARGHGRSEKPHEPVRYGDGRMALDLVEVTQAFAPRDAVAAGYSMGASTVLLALAAGLDVRGAVAGATPIAVLRWTDAETEQRAAAIAALVGESAPDPSLQLWIAFPDAIGTANEALAACLLGHMPVIEHWERIAVPVVVAAGVDDAGAAPLAELASCIAHARVLSLRGDHYSAVSDPAFTDAIVSLARGREADAGA